MSFINILPDETIDILSPQNMSNEYKNLRKHYDSLKDTMDKCKQELYDITRNNNVSKKLINDLEIENENLEKENSNLKETIKTLKNEISNFNKKQVESEDQACDESMLLEKDKEIHKLQTEIESMNSMKITIGAKLEEEVERLTVDNIRLSSEIEMLTEYVSEIKKEHSTTVVEFEQTINNLKEQISQLQNDVKYKQEELIAAEGLRKIMTEELAMQRTEIEMKSTSNKQITKGNSLFAEVDDRRLQVQTEMRNMKQKYMDMKQKLTMKNAQIQKIQIEYEYLLNKFRDQPKEQFEETKLQEEAYQTKIQDLTETIHFLKAELNRSKIEVDIKNDKIPTNMGDFIYNIANASRKEFKALEEKIVSQSADLFILKESLCETKKEVSKWTFEALKHKAKATTQQVELEELKTKLSVQQKEVFNSKPCSVTKGNGNKLQDISNQKSKTHGTIEKCSTKKTPFHESDSVVESKSITSELEIIEQKGRSSDIDFEINDTSDFKTENIFKSEIINEMFDNLSIIDHCEFNLQNKNNVLSEDSNILKHSEYNSSKLLESNVNIESRHSIDQSMKLNEFEDSCRKTDYELKENKQDISALPKDTFKIKKLCFSEDTREPHQTDHSKFKRKGGVIVPIKHRIYIPSKKSNKIENGSQINNKN